MQAPSPLDQIEYMGERVPLPRPMLSIGTRVKPLPQQPDYTYYRKRMLRELLRDSRKTVDNLRRRGFCGGKPGHRLPDFNKAKIRQAMYVYDHSTDVEVAGVCPMYGHVTGHLGDQSYLQSGQCHSGVGYAYFLLFRIELNGAKAVLIHAHPVCAEGRLQA